MIRFLYLGQSEKVENVPGATVAISVVQLPITCVELCFVNNKAGLGFIINVFK